MTDRPGHTRAPRYVRGSVGTVVGTGGEHPLPDDVVAESRRRAVKPFTRFASAPVIFFGTGTHTVTVDLWEAYLRPLSEHGA